MFTNHSVQNNTIIEMPHNIYFKKGQFGGGGERVGGYIHKFCSRMDF